MQAGGVTTQDVYQITGKVIVNGVDVGADVESVSVDRDIPSGLPGSSGFRSATGSVTATVGDLVDGNVATPWTPRGAWPPKSGDSVEVILSDGTREWTQFRGSVKNPSGSTDSRSVTFGVQDNFQPLNRLVNIPAMSNIMPSLTDASHYLYLGLQSAFITDWTLRQAGRHCTPPRASGNVVSATMQGATWPEQGTLIYSQKQTPDAEGSAFPNWRVTNYGLAAHNVDARYEPTIWAATPGGGRIMDAPVEVTQEIVSTEASTYLRVRFEAGGRVALIQTPTQVQAAYYSPGGAVFVLVSASKVDQVRVTARFWMDGTALNAELRTRHMDGRVISAGVAVRGVAQALAGPINHAWANGDGAMGAFQVSFPSTAWSSLAWTPSARIHASQFGRNYYVGLPAQVNIPAVSLLDQISDAELSSWWIDERDVLQWWDRGLMAGQAASGVLTGADHVKSIPWTIDHDATRRQVSVKHVDTAVTARWRTNLTLWQGPGDTLNTGDQDETFINTPDDEVWLGVSIGNAVQYAQITSFTQGLNKGERSVIGGIAMDAFGEERRTNSVIASLVRVTDATFKHSVAVGVLQEGEQVAMCLPTEMTTDLELWPRWLGEKLPILRGKKKVAFTEAVYNSSITGPSSAPDYAHDAGYWIQGATYAGQTADYMAASLTIQAPTIEALDIMPVFALQVGDVIDVLDPEITGLSVRGVVTSNSIDADLAAGSAAQRINILPIAVTRNGRQWRDFGEARQGDQWATFGTDWAASAWSGFGANPLKYTD